MSEPLNRFTKPSVDFVWGDTEKICFEAVKAAILSATILEPVEITDPNDYREVTLSVEASDIGCGAVLEIRDNSSETTRPVCFESQIR